MGRRCLPLFAMIMGAIVWSAIRNRSRRAGRLPKPWTAVKCSLEGRAIRWSGRFLRSMGALESAPRAEQDAMLAHKVACALTQRLGDGARRITVLIIGWVIHLEGEVGSPEDRAEAERIAYEVSRAQVLADDLTVESK